MYKLILRELVNKLKTVVKNNLFSVVPFIYANFRCFLNIARLNIMRQKDNFLSQWGL